MNLLEWTKNLFKREKIIEKELDMQISINEQLQKAKDLEARIHFLERQKQISLRE